MTGKENNLEVIYEGNKIKEKEEHVSEDDGSGNVVEDEKQRENKVVENWGEVIDFIGIIKTVSF